MVSVINEFQLNGTGRNCLYSSIQNVLAYLGLPLKEAEVFFAFQGLETRYDYKKDYFGIDDILSHVQNNLMKEFISIHINDNTCDPKILEADFCQYLNLGIPVICIMQVKKLKYLETLTEYPTGRRHTCVLYGIDLSAGKAYIADAYKVDKLGTVSTFRGEVSLQDILCATTGYFTLERKTKECKFDLKGALIKALSFYTKESVSAEYAWGFKAFTEYILNLKRYEGDSKLYQLKCYDAGYTIKITSVQTYLSYLCEVLKQLESGEESNFKNLLIALEEQKSRWDEFRAKLIRDSFREKEKRDVNLVQSCTLIMERQNDIFKKILEKAGI